MNSFPLAFLLLFSFMLPQPLDVPRLHKQDTPVAASIVLRSTDGGQTWQDISQGLPARVQADGFVEQGSELYLRTADGIFHRTSDASAPFWEKETLPAKPDYMAPTKAGVVAYTYTQGQFLQKVNGLWLPMFPNLQQKQVRTVFEADRGAVFIGSDQGLFKSTDHRKTWKQVYTRGWVMKMVETPGVLLATSQEGIVRSTDGGENWEAVISEGGVGIALEPIRGGFAAITYNTTSETRRVRTSYDGGKTWQTIDAGLPASALISSLVQAGDDLFCGHPVGIFKSSDQGKTWKMILASPPDKVFTLYVSGNVMYATPREGGC